MEIAIFSATIAFLAAMIAQWVSHRLTISREEKKQNDEIVQEFILPVVNDVLLYIDTETDFRKGHDVEIEVDSVKVINKIKSSIKYANKDLVNAVFDYQRSESYFDGRGENRNLATLNLFYVFLEYSIETLNKSKFVNERLQNRLSESMKLYGLAFVCTDLLGTEDTMSLLSYKWAWSSGFYERLPIDVLSKSMPENDLQINNMQHYRLQIINILEREYTRSDVSDLEHLFEILQEAKENLIRL